MTTNDEEEKLLRSVALQNASSILVARQRAEQRREFYLAEGQRLAHVGSWALSPSGFFEYWSPELFQIHGLDPDKGAPKLDEYLASIHPQDRQSMAGTIEKMMRERSGCDVKQRILRPDGELRHVRYVGAPVFNEEVCECFVGTAMDVTEQEHLTQELRRRQAYLTEAQRLSHAGSFSWNVSSGEILWSEEIFRIFEYDRTMKHTLELALQRVHPEDTALVQQTIKRASHDGKDFEFEHRLLMPDGSVKYVHIVAHALSDESGSIEFVGAVMDVTTAKEAEGKIRLIIDTVPALIWTARPDGGLEFISQRWLDYTGMTLEQMLERDWGAQCHPDDIDQLLSKWRAAVAEGKPFETETRVRRFDGEYRWFLSRACPLFDRTGNILGWYGNDTDIHDRKQAEEKLRQDEMELRRITDAIPQAITVLGPEGNALYANRVALEYTGLTLEDVNGGAFRTQVFHPDDVERVRDERQKALARGQPFENEQRARRKDGQYRWFLLRYNPILDEQGRVLRWYATGTDIEDRKQTEERLRDENVALREEIDKASMFEEIVGKSSALQTVLSHLSKVAPTDSTVLVTGETGTGKELVARAIHRRSQRSSRAFVSVNCAAIPRDLIASELFGHEKGAFTGATQQRLGRFELAKGGTIFLDEVGELPAETQIALLRTQSGPNVAGLRL